jgi:hypothetical protein
MKSETSETPSDDKIEFVKNLVKDLARPFTLTELAPQVKDISKKEFEAIFNTLVSSNEVILKVSGKIKIYFYNYKLDAVIVIAQINLIQ